MKVKYLIQNTIWMPGRGYKEGVSPKVSVLLPTFRRGENGLFRRCVDSILTQSLVDIELIIIDDASSDGTADQIREYMEQDTRVSCLRHPENIGLPAISEYEGLCRARAERIAFAFDDNIFNQNALEGLYLGSLNYPKAMVYGYIQFSSRTLADEVVYGRLGENQSLGVLRTRNVIPNGAVLLPRKIIEDVGFYDPHMIMVRLCDWDLWRRVAEFHEIRYVDVFVGVEDGPILDDSLGNTYEIDRWGVHEWMSHSRNHALLPSNFQEYDVFYCGVSLSTGTQATIRSMAGMHASTRDWLDIPLKKIPAKAGSILVVNAHDDASTFLCFSMLPPQISGQVRVITYGADYGPEEMVRATCVIFVRRINIFQPWVNFAKKMRIPIYYYLDDNLPLLASEKEINPTVDDYGIPEIQGRLECFSGVLLTSRALVEYFEKNQLHGNCYYFPVACADQQPITVDTVEDRIEGELVFAIFGDSHRGKGFRDAVFPALEKMVEGGKIHLVVPEAVWGDTKPQAHGNFRITVLPFESNYLYALKQWRRFRPNFLIHPPSASVNNEYKTLNSLLTACLLDAIAILPAGKPYDEAGELGAAIVVADAFEKSSWLRVFAGLPHGVDGIKERNIDFCAEKFSGRENVTLIRELLYQHGGEVSETEQTKRLRRLLNAMRDIPGHGMLQKIQPAAKFMIKQSLAIAYARRSMRYSFCGRFFFKAADLWQSMDPAFQCLKDSSELNGWRLRHASLELSDSLHEVPYREYQIRAVNGWLKSVSFAISADFIQEGIVGVEIISPNDKIEYHSTLKLMHLQLYKPVQFEVGGVKMNAGEFWRIRVFARSMTPVYFYEFINRRFFGAFFKKSTPFMQMNIESY